MAPRKPAAKPKREPSRPLIEDACASCDRPIWVKFTHWRTTESRAGLLLCANYCTAECREIGEADSDGTIERLRERKRRLKPCDL